MKYEYWFAKIQGINLRKKIRLRQCMKTAEAIYYIEETQLKKIEFLNESEQDKILKAKRQDPEKEYESLCEKGIRFIPHFTDEYPEKYDRLLCGGIWCIVQLDYEVEVTIILALLIWAVNRCSPARKSRRTLLQSASAS